MTRGSRRWVRGGAALAFSGLGLLAACGSKSGLDGGDRGDPGQPSGGTSTNQGGTGAVSGFGGGPASGGVAGFGGSSGSAGVGAAAGMGGSAGVFDAGLDAPPDVCIPTETELERQRAELMFVVDRSNSMAFDLSGGEPPPGVPSRWQLMRQALDTALTPNDDFLSIGAKMYPREGNNGTLDELCSSAPGIELPIGPQQVGQFVNLFVSTGPGGGTPTAPAIETARQALESRPDDGTPRFMVLLTDGAPNCNPGAATPATCKCTYLPGSCDEPDVGPYLCLDEDDTLSAIERTFAVGGVPVFVIGFTDPNPLFIDMLNRMAIAGGRPLPSGGRRYYDVQQASDLDEALVGITDSIARCVFAVDGIDPEAFDELTVGGATVNRDFSRQNGWDVTAPGEVTLFGAACNLAGELSTVVNGTSGCGAP